MTEAEPAEPSFELRALDEVEGRYEMRMTGRIYADLAPRIREALQVEGLRSLVVDAGELEQIDSSGLGVFVTLLKEVRPRGGRIVFFGLNQNVRRVFGITKLDRVVEVASTREEALEKVGA